MHFLHRTTLAASELAHLCSPTPLVRLMHPPLHIHKHPHCKQLIEALNDCHRDHPVAKFWGHCNDQKIALDACFRQEKRINSAINRKKARAFQEKFQRSRQEEKRQPVSEHSQTH